MASVDTFVTLLSANQHATYSYVSALTFLSYDIILTSDLEINYIWGSHWSIVKALYFVVRYYAFISLIPTVALITHVNISHNSSVCKHYHSWTVIGGPLTFILILNMIVTLRVWAIYNRDGRLLVVLIILLLTDIAACLWSAIDYARWVNINVIPMPAPWRGCAFPTPKTDMKSIMLTFLPNFILSVIYLGMTLWKPLRNWAGYGKFTWSSLRNMRRMEPLLLSFAFDGTIFFVLACIAIVLGLVARLMTRGVISNILFPWVLVILSYSGAHLILNLRCRARSSSQTWNDTFSIRYDQNAARSSQWSRTLTSI
ncbi:hypothetical protein L208DRAFT_1438034 [Tricholoma matsutake]|nr:hypothetical protein L208DRAFT_1438034 [Tricholoma matsutake 945]